MAGDGSSYYAAWPDADPNGTSSYDDDDFAFAAAGAGLNSAQGGSPLDRMVYQQRLMYYLMGIGGLVVCSFGMVANGLSVAVLTRHSMRSSTYTYLAALAVCDSLVLVFTALLAAKDAKAPPSGGVGDGSDDLDQLYNIYFPYVHPTAIVFQVTSIWLTLAFTVDRYIMICHPFKAERMCRRSRARKVVVALYIAGTVFCIPKFLEYHTKRQEVPQMNSTAVVVYYIDLTAIGKNEIFREIVHSWLYLICVCGIPFLTLVVLNAFLIHAVRMSRLKGKELNAKEKHRNDTTVMLIGVIVIFLICQGPALVSRMIYAFKPPVYPISRADFTLNEVANFLVILNSAINIVPYYFFGKKFRSEFWRLFCSCLFDRDELRKMTRSFSLSVDPGRRWSVASNNYELNGYGGGGGGGVVLGGGCGGVRGGGLDGQGVLGGGGGRHMGRGTFSCTAHRNSSIETPLISSTNGNQPRGKRTPSPVLHREKTSSLSSSNQHLLLPYSAAHNGHNHHSNHVNNSYSAIARSLSDRGGGGGGGGGGNGGGGGRTSPKQVKVTVVGRDLCPQTGV